MKKKKIDTRKMKEMRKSPLTKWSIDNAYVPGWSAKRDGDDPTGCWMLGAISTMSLSRFSRSILCAGDYRSSHHKVIEIEKRVVEKRREKEKEKQDKVCIRDSPLVPYFFLLSCCCCCLVSLLLSLSLSAAQMTISSLYIYIVRDGGLSSFFIVLYRGEKTRRDAIRYETDKDERPV